MISENTPHQKENEPLVSVVIPTYNRCVYVQEAIDSVLEQTYQNYEIFVIDDGSTDDTGKILKYRYGKMIRYHFRKNQGESAARNLGVSLAKGEYIAFLDSDDTWLPEKLSQQVPILNSVPNVAAVFTEVWLVNEHGEKTSEIPLGAGRKPSDFELNSMFIRNRIPGGASTCLMHRGVYEKLGGFASDIQFGEDWELWLNIISNYDIYFIHKPLVAYRQHSQTQSAIPHISQVDKRLADYEKLLYRTYAGYSQKISTELCNRSIAYQYLTASLASYYLGFSDKGKERLKTALDYDQALHHKKSLLHNILMFTTSHVITSEPESSSIALDEFRESLTKNLPGTLNRKKYHHSIIGALKIREGYLYHQNGEGKKAAHLIVEGLKLDPSLINLASLAILSEQILGTNLVNRIRGLKHRNL